MQPQANDASWVVGFCCCCFLPFLRTKRAAFRFRALKGRDSINSLRKLLFHRIRCYNHLCLLRVIVFQSVLGSWEACEEHRGFRESSSFLSHKGSCEGSLAGLGEAP